MRKNRLPLVYRFGKRISKSNAILEQSLNLFHTVITTAGFRVIITILFPFLLSVEMKCTEFKYKWNQVEFYTNIWHIILTVVLYLIFTFLIYSSDKYTKIISKEFDYYKEAVTKQASVNSVIANQIFDLNNYINDKDGNIPTDEGIKNSYNYQKVAQLVCHEIYNIIKNVTSEDNHQVTLFRKFERDNNSAYIQMIAFANKDNLHPITWGCTYELNTNLKKKSYQQKIFEENNSKLSVLMNKSEVCKAFIYHKKNDERVACIEQCICIPIFCQKQRVISVLQIDTDVPDLFGRTYDDISKFCRLFLPFIHLLLVNYNEERLIYSFWGKIKYRYKSKNNSYKQSKLFINRSIGKEI